MSHSTNTGDPGPRPLVIHQPATGYRYSVDALLLASFVSLGKRSRVIDLGSGVGVIGLLLCARYPDCLVWGVEIQERLFQYAERNRLENGLEARVRNVLGDFRDPASLPKGIPFDSAVSNPPYRAVGSGRLNRDDGRTMARHETAGGLEDVVTAARSALRAGGRLSFVYPARRAADLIESLRRGGFEPKRARFIHPREGEDAGTVMVEARKGGGKELVVLPPLYVWKSPGVYTDEARSMVDLPRVNSY